MLDFLNARTDMRRKAGKIYGVIVTQARRPSFYADLGVPDTPSGRYEMVVVHLVLVLERLRSAPVAGAELPRLLVEAFIADMDDSLREMGTGDLTVPKKVRRAATGLYERSVAYQEALATRDGEALAALLREHTYAEADAQFAPRLAGYVQAAAAALAATDAHHIEAGSFEFPEVPHQTEGAV
ncbi:MAG: ubiquinol-cytochrome C chaperone [Hyphomicrobium sp.]|nr:ubiquinol-cytochrome C chaperone [Hyphomicrobium sp.]